MTEVLLTVEESAEHLRVGPETIRRYIKTGYLKAFVLPGGDYRISQSDMQQMLSRQVQNGDNNGN